ANAGSAFHTPTANDRFGFGGNPQLKPEKALDYELAVRQQLTPAQDVELRFDQSVNAFNAFNVDRARMEGVQLRWSYGAQPWRAQASMIYQDPRDLTTGQRLLRRPRWAGSAHLDRRLGRFDLGGDIYAAGNRADVDGITGATGVVDGGYVLFGLHGGVRLDARTRLQLRLGNLLDHRYQTVNGYNQPGRTVYVTLRYTLPG
ncbi:MAG TPA: TonB-dependent receptor, partial [Nevskiaceae bacterium]